jgi:hypothetical protein
MTEVITVHLGEPGPKGSKGDKGDKGDPGPNTVPTNEAIAAAVTVAGPTNDALEANYVGYGKPVPNALTGWFHADGYGVDLTGATNSTATFQAILNAASEMWASTGRQQTVYWRGIVKLSSKLVARDGVHMRGHTRTEAKIIAPISEAAIFYEGWYDEPLTDASFTDFEIDGSLQTGSYNVARKGIYTTFHENVRFENLYIHDTQATGLGVDHFHGNCIVRDNIIENCGSGNDGFQPGGNGIGLGIGAWPDGIDSVIVEGNYVSGTGRFGIMVEQQDQSEAGRGVRIIGNYCTDNQHGIVDCGATGAVIMGNQCIGNTGSGIQLNSGTYDHGSGPHPGNRGIIANNICSQNGSHGISGDFTDYMPENAGYIIHDNVCDANLGAGIRFALANTDIRGLMVHHNMLTNNGIGASSDSSKAGLSLGAPAGTGKFVDCTFSDNTLNGNGGWGAYVSAGLTDCDIERNITMDTQGVATQTIGIEFTNSATLTGVRVFGNNVDDSTTPMVINSGTITACEFERNKGYNPSGPITISVGASPFTYTNGAHRGVVYVKDGTVSLITKGGLTVAAASNREISIAPNQSIIVTYSVAPIMILDRL